MVIRFIATHCLYWLWLALPTFADTLPPVRLANFTTNNETVLDMNTGLRWQRCSLGLTWQTDNKCSGKYLLFNFEQSRRLNAWSSGPLVEWIELDSVWRVPTKNELQTLIDPTQQSFKINSEIFPDIGENLHAFWTADMHGGGQAWYIDFKDGYVGFVSGDYANSDRKLNVRLVHVER